MLKLVPIENINEKIKKNIIDLFVQTEKEIGTMEGVPLRELLNKTDLKLFSALLKKMMSIHTEVIMLHGKPIGLCSLFHKSLEIKGINRQQKYVLLDNISITPQHRKKGIATRIITHFAKKHSFFGISRPIQSTILFWEKIIKRLFEQKITTSYYKVHYLSQDKAGYECLGGIPIVVFDETTGEPILGIRDNFTLDEQISITNYVRHNK